MRACGPNWLQPATLAAGDRHEEGTGKEETYPSPGLPRKENRTPLLLMGEKRGCNPETEAVCRSDEPSGSWGKETLRDRPKHWSFEDKP